MTTIPHENPVGPKAVFLARGERHVGVACDHGDLAHGVRHRDLRPRHPRLDPSGDSTTIPSAVAIALCAVLATTSIAKYRFDRKRHDG